MNSDDEEHIHVVALKCSHHALDCLNYIQLKSLAKGRVGKNERKVAIC